MRVNGMSTVYFVGVDKRPVVKQLGLLLNGKAAKGDNRTHVVLAQPRSSCVHLTHIQRRVDQLLNFVSGHGGLAVSRQRMFQLPKLYRRRRRQDRPCEHSRQQRVLPECILNVRHGLLLQLWFCCNLAPPRRLCFHRY